MKGLLLGVMSLLLWAAMLGAATAQEKPPTPVAEVKQKAGFDQEHQAFHQLLQTFVKPGGFVDYRGLLKSRASLDAYLLSLQAVKAVEFAKWSGLEREAFWINAYNAFTLSLILDNYPVESIKDLGGLFSSVFSKEFIPLSHLAQVDKRSEVGTRGKLSLGEVEHDILAQVSRTPLFHFAIVCASWSCPELRNEAYTAVKLDKQLHAQARQFLADSRKNDIRLQKGRYRVSKIFDWAEAELKDYPGGIRAILGEFGPATITEDPGFAEAKLKYRDYDWSLNEWQSPEDNKE